MNLFIDANIYLNYFRVSSENTDSLSALLRILQTKKNLRLLLPEQTLQEYSRNRNNIVNETKLALKAQKDLKFILPPIVRNWPEAEKLSNKCNFTKQRIKIGLRRILATFCNG